MKILFPMTLGILSALMALNVSAASLSKGCIERICIGMSRAEVLNEYASDIRAGAKYTTQSPGFPSRPSPTISLQLDEIPTEDGTRFISATFPQEGGRVFFVFSGSTDLGELDADGVNQLLRSTYGPPSSFEEMAADPKTRIGHLVYCWGQNCPAGSILESSAMLTDAPANTVGIKIMAHVEVAENRLTPLSVTVFSYDPVLKARYDAATLKWFSDSAGRGQ